MRNNLVTSTMVVCGEGSVSPVFMGCLWIKDDRESDEASEIRYAAIVARMGLEYLRADEQP